MPLVAGAIVLPAGVIMPPAWGAILFAGCMALVIGFEGFFGLGLCGAIIPPAGGALIMAFPDGAMELAANAVEADRVPKASVVSTIMVFMISLSRMWIGYGRKFAMDWRLVTAAAQNPALVKLLTAM
ncbi:MAG: hypothetical protein JO348_05405 [Alphaproteobacteria bacterium]|nr:hypothetical protein [Alphaproteobacteria bacterium]MBV9540549.1 hypothetical protein [Alphaproteobacteria bacterium]MBV9904994.1 hypothetical protein [Alphaproteobacteria bacterium]